MEIGSSAPLDSFRRNLILVSLVHAALLGSLWFFARTTKRPVPEQITWLDGGGFSAPVAAPAPPPKPTEAVIPIPPEPEPAPPPRPSAEPEEIVPPKPAPTPTPKVAATPTPKPEPKPTATPRPKPTPAIARKPTPKPAPRPQVAKVESSKPTPKETSHNASTSTASASPPSAPAAHAGNVAGANPGPGAPNGGVSGAEVQTYYGIVGSRFKSVWDNPLTTISTGQELVARVRLRINADGTILSATLVRSTGNQEVDSSIEKAFPRFQKVPPPPAGLLKAGVFEESMDVILGL